MDSSTPDTASAPGTLKLDEPAGARLVRLVKGCTFGELDAAQAFAPGQPLMLRCGPLLLQGKSHGSRRQADGRFCVRFKFVNLTRPQREALETSSRAAGLCSSNA